MATRFYLPASGTPPLSSLAVDSGWTRSDNLERRPCFTTKTDTALTQKSATWATTSTSSWVWVQFQSKPMTAAYDWTAADTVSMVIKVAEAAAQVDSHLSYVVRVVSGDGATIRGTIGAYRATSSEYPTSLATIATRIHDARTDGATVFSSQVGDRIIIEIGHWGVTPTLNIVYHNYGDPSATQDQILVAGETTDYCPWVELSRTVAFDYSTSDSQPAYTKGSVAASATPLPAFIKGGVLVSDSQSAYVEGSAAVTPASDSHAAYTKGASTAVTSKAAFLPAGSVITDNISAYIMGYVFERISISAFVQGIATATSSTPAFVAGTSQASDSQGAFTVSIKPPTPFFNEYSTPTEVLRHSDTPGEWDYIIWSATSPSDILKVGDTYYMYYTGAQGEDGNGEGIHRALGVATSKDGVHFTKYAGNPIVTYNPGGGGYTQEGVGNAIVIYKDGTFHMWYSAIHGTGSGLVDLYVRYRSSTNGLDFSGDTLVYQVSGQEHQPIGAYHDGTNYVLYMHGNNVAGKGPIHVIWGTSPTSLSNDTAVTSDTFGGSGNIQFIDSILYIWYLNRSNASYPKFQVRWGRKDDYDFISGIVNEYTYGAFVDYACPCVLYEPSASRWLFYTQDVNNGTIVMRHVGAVDILESRQAYVKGQLSSSSSKGAYVSGIGQVSDNQNAFTKGSATTTTSKNSFIFGSIFVNDSQNAYVEGFSTGGDSTGSHNAFVLGLDNGLVPDGDITVSGNWLNELNSPNNLYLSIDEYPTANDSDFIWNTDPQTGYYYECSLSNPAGNIGDGDVVVLWRGRDKSDSGKVNAHLEFKQGSTIIASGTRLLTATRTTYFFTLTPAQKASVTDWTDVRARVTIIVTQ